MRSVARAESAGNVVHGNGECDPIARLELALRFLALRYNAQASDVRDEQEQRLRLLAQSDNERSLSVDELACIVAEREIGCLRESRASKNSSLSAPGGPGYGRRI